MGVPMVLSSVSATPLEAVAETLSLNLDPYPRAPEADAVLRAAGVRREGGEEKENPFAALAGLKDKLKK